MLKTQLIYTIYAKIRETAIILKGGFRVHITLALTEGTPRKSEKEFSVAEKKF